MSLEGEVPVASPYVGKRVADLGLDDTGLAVAIRRGLTTIVRVEATTLAAGDRVVVVARPGRADEVLARFREGTLT
jgi:Trk K+ transport system NAD-binding subunit